MLGLAFLIVALILFLIAFVGVDTGRYSLLALGLAFLTASFLFTAMKG